MDVIKNRIVRWSVFCVGILSLTLGAIGAFLPILPTTPFVLLAAWCFLKSSKRAHRWIYQQPLFGQALRDWDRDRSIARSNKILAVSSIVLSIVIIWIKVDDLWIKYLVTTFLLFISVFIVARNER